MPVKNIENMNRQCIKIVTDRRSQIIRIPKEFQFDTDELYIKKEGNNIILSPKPKSWKDFFEKTPLPSEDFMSERIDLNPQQRDDMF